jgi:Ni,Fe-hydrogenase I large subunit
MRRLVAGPFNRVEGDLDVHLDIEQGRVREARVSAPLFRGFEPMLSGRAPLDALVIAPRICGICSIAQSVAAARALAASQGLTPANNGRLAANLVLAAENAADHLVHFALFFMPDFARAAYASRPWHGLMKRRFEARTGKGVQAAAMARSRLFHLMGTLAGKWPHSLALQPGGTTKPVDKGELAHMRGVLAEFRAFLEDALFAGPLEGFAHLSSLAGMKGWAAEPAGGDVRLFLAAASDLDLAAMGKSGASLMSYGAYEDGQGGHLFPRGLIQDGQPARFDPANIREDTSHAWYEAPPLHPWEGRTQPDPDRKEAYSWCKAPRLDGQPVEVGAFARQLIAGHPLIWELYKTHGSTVLGRVVARLIELARLVPALEGWLAQLEPGAPFCHPSPNPWSFGAGAGLIEAARGSLGHWLTIADGVIRAYQIIAPTTWNFSPRDEQGQPGPAEKALEGVAVEPGEAAPVAVQHVVRSFDPCMVCTVH